MTTKEAASRLGVTHSQVCRYIKHGLQVTPKAQRVFLVAELVPWTAGKRHSPDRVYKRDRYDISAESIRAFNAAVRRSLAAAR